MSRVDWPCTIRASDSHCNCTNELWSNQSKEDDRLISHSKSELVTEYRVVQSSIDLV